jgi:hypothetical protein
MAQWVGYHIGDEDDSIPVATGATKDEARGKAVRRILAGGVSYGMVGAQERPELSAEEFATLTKVVDDFHTERGIA